MLTRVIIAISYIALSSCVTTNVDKAGLEKIETTAVVAFSAMKQPGLEKLFGYEVYVGEQIENTHHLHLHHPGYISKFELFDQQLAKPIVLNTNIYQQKSDHWQKHHPNKPSPTNDNDSMIQ